MLRVVIVEADPEDGGSMGALLAKHAFVEVAGVFTQADKALRALPRLNPDAVFFDADLPSGAPGEPEGLALARRIRALDDAVGLILAAHTADYAYAAFGVGAVHYLLYPVAPEALDEAVTRLVGRCRRLQAVPSGAVYTIHALGGLEVYGALPGVRVRFPTARVQELFARLVLSGGRELGKWRLAESMWPGASPEHALHSLHSAVNRLRGALAEAGVSDLIAYQNAAYRADFSAFTCDVWQLEAFLRDNPRATPQTLRRFDRLPGLYRGDLFGDEDYPWAVEARERLQRAVLEALSSAAACHQAAGNHEAARLFLEHTLAVDPCDEEAAMQLMRVHFEAGNQSGIVDCYMRLRKNLGSLGLRPGQTTTRAMQAYLGRL